MRKGLPLALLALALPAAARAATFDLATEYRIRALTYKNLDLNRDTKNDRSLLSQQARLGFALKNIPLEGAPGGEDQTMEIAVRLQALGVAGSSTPLAAPFDRIADRYPNTAFTPFIENAYLKLNRLAGMPGDLVVGRQSFRLGSGLLLDDDGAGLTGLSGRWALPWWDMKTEAFVFTAANDQLGPNDLDVFGFSLELPTEGVWQLQQLIEKDRTTQRLPVNGCGAAGCLVGRATRWFSALRYQISYGPIVFDGEAVLQKGAATPTGPAPARNHITFNGNAQVLKAKWKQPFFKDKQGIARLLFARGSGDDPGTPTTDEAFFPSRGHRYDGLERSGFGEFFGATPYDAFGGHSTSTRSGLAAGNSGIVTVGIGVTPPAWRGVVLDIDYYLFQADRNSTGPHRTLGTELDLRLRYDIRDRLRLSASAAFFTAGPASNPTKGGSRRYMLEASGRF